MRSTPTAEPKVKSSVDEYIRNCLWRLNDKLDRMTEAEKRGLHARLVELATQFSA